MWFYVFEFVYGNRRLHYNLGVNFLQGKKKDYGRISALKGFY